MGKKGKQRKSAAIALVLMTAMAGCKGPAHYPPAVMYYPLGGYSYYGMPYYNHVYYMGPRAYLGGGYVGFRPWGSSWGVYRPVYSYGYGGYGYGGYNSYSFARSGGGYVSRSPSSFSRATGFAGRGSGASTTFASNRGSWNGTSSVASTPKKTGFWSRFGSRSSGNVASGSSGTAASRSTNVGSGGRSSSSDVRPGSSVGSTRGGFGSTGKGSSVGS